jgi:tetratricopeptide (TPR) repeat protein
MSATAKRIAIASLLVVLAFFPSLFAEVCTVDDLDMYKWLAGSDPSFKDLFFPQATGGAYYRPLIGVSYLFDKYVWFLDTRLMHLDNILFHLTNAMLLYYLAYLLLPRTERGQSMIPFISSLLFGLHPITTESVAWISGRTDIMACTFVLLSTVFLLKFRETRKFPPLVLALLVLLPGLLIKETPLAFFLGALFILLARSEDLFKIPREDGTTCGEISRCVAFAGVAVVLLIVTYNVWLVFLTGLTYLCYEVFRDRKAGKPFQTTTALMIAVGAALPIALFFLIRKLVFASTISSVARTMKLIVDDLNYACQTFFGTAGFYVKKFFFPFPLNLAIREIDPMYNAAGVVVFFLCLYAIRRRSMNTALFLAGVCLFLPALPLSLGTVTWTAYAERYMYMSTAFWALSLSLWVGRVAMERGYGRTATVCAAVLLMIMGVCTFQRSMVWRTNLSLMCDTVEKSPGFKLIRVDYMTALMGIGDLEGAKAQYRVANNIPSVGYMESLDINMAAIHVMEGKYDEATKLYEQVIRKTRGKSAVAYWAYIDYLQRRYSTALKDQNGSVPALGAKLVENMENLYQLNKDPMLLYSSGQLSIALGKCDEALRLFRESKKGFSATNEYARFASRLVSGLEEGRCRQGGS